MAIFQSVLNWLPDPATSWGTLKSLLLAGVVLVVLYVLIVKLSYNHKEFAQADSPVRAGGGYVVQFNELGQLWNPNEAEEALAAITESAARTNTIVVVFIHGWHHTAQPNDGNVIDFARAMSEVTKVLGTGEYRRSREYLTGHADVNVFGIYIGWRGRSLPGPLDYATFYGRKAAAERLGRGALRPFLLRLKDLYDHSNAPTATGSKPFMGLVSIGHSFGGQALFRAVETSLESELIQAAQSGSVGEASIAQVTELSGFGDLVILLNPALEALQYETIHLLNKRLRYGATQAPVFIVASAPNDSARLFFFPVGRALYTLFGPRLTGEQIRRSTQALGVFEPQRTHNVSVLAPETEQLIFEPRWYIEQRERILEYDLSNIPTIAGLRLEPTEEHQAFNPFLVAHVDGSVLVKHSGIFEAQFRQFLVDYIAVAQGKRVLARSNGRR